MNKRLLTIAILSILTTNMSIQAYGWGGYGYPGFYGGYGYPGFYGGYGGWYGPGLYGGLYFANLAAYNNRSNVDPVAQAEANQIRYETQKQREEDRAYKQKQGVKDRSNNKNKYDNDEDQLNEIKKLKQEIADLESQLKIRK